MFFVLIKTIHIFAAFIYGGFLITDNLFLTKIKKSYNEEPKRVNIDFPAWMVQSLDKEAKHVGVSRQAVIKMWLAEKLQSLNTTTAAI